MSKRKNKFTTYEIFSRSGFMADGTHASPFLKMEIESKRNEGNKDIEVPGVSDDDDFLFVFEEDVVVLDRKDPQFSQDFPDLNLKDPSDLADVNQCGPIIWPRKKI